MSIFYSWNRSCQSKRITEQQQKLVLTYIRQVMILLHAQITYLNVNVYKYTLGNVKKNYKSGLRRNKRRPKNANRTTTYTRSSYCLMRLLMLLHQGLTGNIICGQKICISFVSCVSLLLLCSHLLWKLLLFCFSFVEYFSNKKKILFICCTNMMHNI